MKTAILKTSEYLTMTIGYLAALLAARRAREVTLDLSCPFCSCKFQVADPTDDNEQVHCEKCTRQFRLAAGLSWLDWLEFKIPLSIAGCGVFITRRIPAWIMSKLVGLLAGIEAFLNWVLPRVRKCVKVTGWVLYGVSIGVVPAMVFHLFAVGADWLLPSSVQFVSAALWLMAIAWLLLVAGGYAWAWVGYRRQRKQHLRQLPPLAMPVSPMPVERGLQFQEQQLAEQLSN